MKTIVKNAGKQLKIDNMVSKINVEIKQEHKVTSPVLEKIEKLLFLRG